MAKEWDRKRGGWRKFDTKPAYAYEAAGRDRRFRCVWSCSMGFFACFSRTSAPAGREGGTCEKSCVCVRAKSHMRRTSSRLLTKTCYSSNTLLSYFLTNPF